MEPKAVYIEEFVPVAPFDVEKNIVVNPTTEELAQFIAAHAIPQEMKELLLLPSLRTSSGEIDYLYVHNHRRGQTTLFLHELAARTDLPVDVIKKIFYSELIRLSEWLAEKEAKRRVEEERLIKEAEEAARQAELKRLAEEQMALELEQERLAKELSAFIQAHTATEEEEYEVSDLTQGRQASFVQNGLMVDEDAIMNLERAFSPYRSSLPPGEWRKRKDEHEKKTDERLEKIEQELKELRDAVKKTQPMQERTLDEICATTQFVSRNTISASSFPLFTQEEIRLCQEDENGTLAEKMPNYLESNPWALSIQSELDSENGEPQWSRHLCSCDEVDNYLLEMEAVGVNVSGIQFINWKKNTSVFLSNLAESADDKGLVPDELFMLWEWSQIHTYLPNWLNEQVNGSSKKSLYQAWMAFQENLLGDCTNDPLSELQSNFLARVNFFLGTDPSVLDWNNPDVTKWFDQKTEWHSAMNADEQPCVFVLYTDDK